MDVTSNKNIIPNLTEKSNKIFQMAEFVLKNNYFEFNGQIKQISGTTIGTKCAPTYACIYMDKMKRKFLAKQEYKPFTWFRYIDIFFIWTHGEDKLKAFLENLNQFHPNLNFTHEPSTESIPFLDLHVKLSQGKLETDVHIKPTDRHQYLHYSSWFLKCGYSNNVIEKEIKKVKFSKISSTRKNNTKGVPLVVTYHPGLKSINQIINKNLQLLYMDQEVKKVYRQSPWFLSVVPVN